MPATPKLKMAHSEAQKLITIQLGKFADHLSIHELSKSGLTTAGTRFEKWDTENAEVLLEMFFLPGPAVEYAELPGKGPVSGGASDGFEIESAVRIRKTWLKEFRERILSYNEEILAPVQSDFWPLIHPEISPVAKTKFEHGHYADAVESALKHVNNAVKSKFIQKTGKELDGKPLMTEAFSVNKPIIVLADQSTASGRDVQEGFMHIFTGSILGVRNPKAHDNLTIGTDRAIHFLFLASLLMHKLDEAV